ncbi:MAG: hypothetical protein GXP49_18070 [Deltaproteobacteria bacterium]|nr:hypothetical protein [Deltaproteobacteria bacterium]
MLSKNISKVPENVKNRLDAAARSFGAYHRDLQAALQSLSVRRQEQFEAGKKRAEELLSNVEAQVIIKKTSELYLKIQALISEWQSMVQEHLTGLTDLLGVISVSSNNSPPEPLKPKPSSKSRSVNRAASKRKKKSVKTAKKGGTSVAKKKAARKSAKAVRVKASAGTKSSAREVKAGKTRKTGNRKTVKRQAAKK